MHPHKDTEQTDSLDPVALTLVFWLGLVTCAVGLDRMFADASLRAALAQAAGDKVTTETVTTPAYQMQMAAFGG